MKDFKIKIGLIYIPMVLTTIGVVIFYSLLNWLFVIKLEWIMINDAFIDLLGPAITSFLAVYLILRLRIKLLRLKDPSKGYFGTYMVTSLLIAFPTIIAQNYLATATGKLSKLKDISEYSAATKTKYYQLDHFYLYKNVASFSTSVETSGKHGTSLDFTLYCVQPILRKDKDTITTRSCYFFCNTYQHKMSNSKSESEKKYEYNAFIKRSLDEYRRTNFDNFSYLEALKITTTSKKYKEAQRNNTFHCEEPLLFVPRYGNFSDRNGGSFGWIFKSFAISISVFFLIVLFLGYKPASTKKKKAKPKSWKEKLKNDLLLLIPKEKFFITPILLNINILFFVIMVLMGLGFISFDSSDLFDYGGLERNAVLNGDWWRLVTAMFMHGGFMHILSNLVTLVMIGLFLEPILGSKRFILFYLICGLVGGFSSIYWHDSSISVGASGAIFGMFGVMLALMLMKSVPKEINKILLYTIIFFIAYNLFMGLFTNADNAAHIGGLVAGFMLGLIISPSIENERNG